MKHRFLLAYQILTGLSDTSTGILLIFFPALTLRLMGLHSIHDALTYISYIGTFVLSVGLSCLYGALLVGQRSSAAKLETVWLLTAITRGCVAIFVIVEVASGALEPGWIVVAVSDGFLALLQAVGLAKGWLGEVLV